MAEEFDAYYKWLGIPPKDQPPNHYRLLGLETFENDEEVIDMAAERQASYLHDIATGPQLKYSQELLNEVAAARLCLLNKRKKQAYDTKLKSQMIDLDDSSGGVGLLTDELDELMTPADTDTLPVSPGGTFVSTSNPLGAPVTPAASSSPLTISPAYAIAGVAALFVALAVIVALLFSGGSTSEENIVVDPPSPVDSGDTTNPGADGNAEEQVTDPPDQPSRGATDQVVTEDRKPALVAHFEFQNQANIVKSSVGNHQAKSSGLNVANGVLPFDGKSGRFELPPVLKSTDSFSIAFWICARPPKSDAGLIDSSQGNGKNLKGLRAVLTKDGKVVLNLSQAQVSSQPLADGKWHRVALLHDAKSQELAIYVDGQSAGSVPSASPANLAGQIHVGLAAAKSPFAGAISDLRIYDGALPADEVKRLASGAPTYQLAAAATSNPPVRPQDTPKDPTPPPDRAPTPAVSKDGFLTIKPVRVADNPPNVVDDNQTLLVRGAPERFTVWATLPFDKVTGVRIDAVPSDIIGGPGTGPDGTFRIREVVIGSGSKHPKPISIVQVTVSENQRLASRLIDQEEGVYWTGPGGRPSSMTFYPGSPFGKKGDQLAIRVSQSDTGPLGSFRISVTNKERNLPPLPLMVNLGGDTVEDGKGVRWLKSETFREGWFGHVGGSAKKDASKTDAPFNSAIEGIEEFRMTVIPGEYIVELFYSDRWLPNKQSRAFRMEIEGKQAGHYAKDLSIMGTKTRNANTRSRPFVVDVKDGELTMTFKQADEKFRPPLLNGIRISQRRR